ncbi:MAG: class I SAM-dependent DNA methyltransferase [Terriglobales bacterium]
MDSKYAEQYRELFEKHWWWRARTEVIIETLRRLRSSNKWDHILDVGCGDGLFFPRLLEFGAVEGIEPASQIVDAKNESRIYSCPFDENFRPPHKYSLILMLDVLEHLPDPVRALSHARELLEPNGILMITVPAFMALWTNHDVLNHHFTRYTKASLNQLTAIAGLRIAEARYFFFWMAAAKLVVRVVERAFATEPKLPHVPHGWMNRSLYSISRMEQKILGKLPVPVGSSLIAVVEAQ